MVRTMEHAAVFRPCFKYLFHSVTVSEIFHEQGCNNYVLKYKTAGNEYDKERISDELRS
jgi:hypothetical protein